ncbi:RsmF rRNA methyltransferase first C-terminal domain-containing protein [Murimonas intestini]|uniref:NOL1/NOP2/sun family putative RNA methylase n=1 Tax=Murimonas intestini TaxID=1337051 RepID=A0AB73SYJ3_9FIRM|nr:RsmB/NOP family class I SAM-dependent RNA methyltransferase [Murimonas intestini]MCR1840329.1 RsmB/NOP family class I SAM-dependent RNA methyltransferase [Murimonas intestini]MCR1868206.1 RsmB/NOP family class I SAM-dependent RNA methyltransferase [Murimonas intestini]MCR1885556.1 RsmB/NOP family class I SAM-dependent RNA methyltransferase [Murimonas intestini]
MKLPEAFADKMKNILGKEYEAFEAGYDMPRQYGLRVNTLKISTEKFEHIAPFHLTKIPWIENGYYYEEEDAPSRHPYYYAGLYYLQEPSAMTPASRLPVNPGEKVLDLCAAPGGKATELGARLRGEGLLVANDISASRAKALLKNVEVFGIPNSFLINEVPGNISDRFEEFFDKILVDAPCSGEGMFRKEPEVMKAWSEDKPAACARVQKEIILQAAKMLRPGGMLLYSTCTFSPEENEQVIQYLLDNREDFELVPAKGYDGFSEGRPDLAGGNEELKKCVRIWPHKMQGEGHFLALLHKKGDSLNTGAAAVTSAVQDGQQKEEKAVVPASEGLKGAKNITKTDKAVLEEFFCDVYMDIDWSRVEIRKGQVYYVPGALGEQRGVNFLRNGLYLGELKKDRFEPSQSFAMALHKSDYRICLNFPWTDSRVSKYLRGETVTVDDMPIKRQRGWQLICVNGYPLGWGKLVNGLLKNKYLPGWRMR